MLQNSPKYNEIDITSQVKSIQEERLNMASHAFGVILFIILIPVLLFHAYGLKNNYYTLGAIVFSISLLMVYISSTFYHHTLDKAKRKKWRTYDHISIYFLIAGSYTPFLLTYFRDQTGLIVLAIIWSIVLIGSLFKWFFTHKFKLLSTLAYLAMGWMALFLIEPILLKLPYLALVWLVIGGLSYSIGVVFFLWEKLFQNHFIWHMFVLGGSFSHYMAVYYCID
ncbi:MAG: hemolysin III family protein [Saprospiraceae bacterium]|nr:hemolysin III family protein [Bacteroidia bacterium]NNL92218.1 hemolysin III family protein [Saprospiraceae bacterium]